MSLKGFELFDNEIFGNSIIRRGFSGRYSLQGAILNNPDQNMELISGGNNNYHEIGNANLQCDITVTNHYNADFADDTVKRL